MGGASGQRAPPASFLLTTEGACMTDVPLWEKMPPGATQRRNLLLQPMEFLGDTAIFPDVHGVTFHQYAAILHFFRGGGNKSVRNSKF